MKREIFSLRKGGLMEAVLFYLNIPIILLGIFFLLKAKSMMLKIVYSIPLLCVYLLFLIGCPLNCMDEVVCREAGWLFIYLPIVLVPLGIVEIILFKIFAERKKRITF